MLYFLLWVWQKQNEPELPKEMTDAEVSASFSKFYRQRAAQEFAEDLDRVRGAEDFRDDLLPLLINALQQGTSVFSIEEQKRVITAGVENPEKQGGDWRCTWDGVGSWKLGMVWRLSAYGTLVLLEGE